MTLKSGQARVQFIACRNEIYDMLRLGHSLKSIHRILISDGKISFRYETLWRLMNVKYTERNHPTLDGYNDAASNKQYPSQKKKTDDIAPKDKTKPGTKILSVDEQRINQLRFDDKELF